MYFNRNSVAKSIVSVVLAVFSCAGTAFCQRPSVIRLYDFQFSLPTNHDGAGPLSEMVADERGNLYGVTYSGGICNPYEYMPCGTVFELSPPAVSGGTWIETVIYKFGTNPGDGNYPVGLVRDKLGALYGATYKGGPNDCGTFFQLSPPSQPGGSWIETVLHGFYGFGSNSTQDGCTPDGNLVMDGKGNIFGTTIAGGGDIKGGPGTIFEMSPPTTSGGSWTESFTPAPIGNWPSGLTIGKHDVLYGTTSVGVFRLTPPSSLGGDWENVILYTFQKGGTDASQPSGSMVLDGKGNLYGVSGYGGTSNFGTVFKLVSPAKSSRAWTEEILYSFQGGDDGSYPAGGLVFDGAGSLVGTTETGGTKSAHCDVGCGTIFRLAHVQGGWSEKVFHRFLGLPSGGQIPNGLVRLANGEIYGATYDGGAFGSGIVYELYIPKKQ